MSIYKMCTEWSKTIADGGDERAYRRWRNCNVYYSGRTIYSYGEHFAMAYILAPNVVWVNGDRVSNSTTNHQSHLRAAIQVNAPDATVIIVPESALGAAGVHYSTIEPVDVKPETFEYTLQTSATPPVDMTPATEGAYGSYGDLSYLRLRLQECLREYDDIVGKVTRDGSTQLVRHINGKYHWHNVQHWLGDSVFTGERSDFHRGTTERVYFISSFDRQETQPLYFLSQLPHPVATFEDAIESLSPESVKTARDMGRTVVRQGDIFAIPMNVTTHQLKAMGARIKRRKARIEWVGWAKEALAQRKAIDEVKQSMPDVPARQYGLLYQQWRDAMDAWEDELARRCAERYPELWPNGLTRLHLHPPKPNRRWHTTRSVDAMPLYGTAHTATEVATLPDGRQFARGVMYHDPAAIGESRQPDHRRRPLGDQRTWHLIARNTVPVQGTGTGRRVA